MKIIRTWVCSFALLLPAGVFAQGPLSFLHKGDTVLFQGDSITDGGRWRDGSDFNHIMGQDYAYILAAQIGEASPDKELVFLNRGIGGERTADLAARWRNDALAPRPNLLSILVGINDMLADGARFQTVEQYEAVYDRLLAETTAALPGTKIVLGMPFLLPVGNYKTDYAARRSELDRRRSVVSRLGRKYGLPVIDYQSAFDLACRKAPAEHWSWDGVHPTYAGHGLMAKEWLRTVEATWERL